MSGRASSRKLATYEDLLKVPDNLVAEILDGELIASPRPSADHAGVATTLAMDLGPFQRGRGGPGGWWILIEPELHLADDVVVPDVAAWRVERSPARPSGAAVKLAPDWICEVLSPSTARIDRIRKLRIYAREHVRHAWLIDPLARTLEVYVLEGAHYVLIGQHEEDALVRAPPFESIEIDLLALWGETRAPAAP